MTLAAFFHDLDEALTPVLDPGIYVEPTDRGDATEEARQAAWVMLMRRTAKACRVYAVPNGAKRTRWEAAKAKREGMLAGEPDTGVSWADGPTARLEWKNGKAGPTDEQIEALNWYHRRGHPVAVVRTVDGAMAWLRSIGAPVPAVIA